MAHFPKYSDPNVGTIKRLPKITVSQRLAILKNLQRKLRYTTVPISSEAAKSSIILVFGGIDPRDPENLDIGTTVFMYLIQEARWVDLGQMPEPRNYHTACYLRGRVYIAGGFDPTDVRGQQMLPTCSTFQFSLRTRRWRKMMDMSHNRACHGAAVLDESMIVLGGIDTHGNILSSVEIYHPESNQWNFLRTMMVPLMGMGVAVLEDTIWVVGGLTDLRQYTTNSPLMDIVLCYEPIQNCWYKKCPLPTPRAYAAAITIRREVWAWGGMVDAPDILDAPESIDNAEVFNPIKCAWVTPFCLTTPKHSIALAKSGGNIFGFGGMSTPCCMPVDDVDCFDYETNLFTKICRLPYALTGTAAVGIPNFYAKELAKVPQDPDEDQIIQATLRIQRAYRAKRQQDQQSSAIDIADNPNGYKVSKVPTFDLPFDDELEEEDFDEEMMDEDLDDDEDRRYDRCGGRRTRPLVELEDEEEPLENLMGDMRPSMVRCTREIAELEPCEDRRKPHPERTSISYIRRYPKLCPTLQPSELDLPSIPSFLKREGWKTLCKVMIPRWPPYPDPTTSASFLSLTRGVISSDLDREGEVTEMLKIRRYRPLPEELDPNLGMTLMLDNDYRRAKKILGLREVVDIPFYALNMTIVQPDEIRDNYSPIILTLGGFDPRDPLNQSYGKSILKFHPLNNKWSFCGLMPEARNAHSAAICGDIVFITGGNDLNRRISGEMVATRNVFAYDIRNMDWCEKSEMLCARSYHSTVYLPGSHFLYSIGGRDDTGRLVASIESYNIEMDEWEAKRPMPEPRMGMGVTIFESRIWIIGGVGGLDEEDETNPVMSSIIIYDPCTDGYEHTAPLHSPRAFCSTFALKDAIWICGGCTGSRCQKNKLISLGSVDVFDAVSCEWSRRGRILTPRHCNAGVLVDGCIFLFGGMCSQEYQVLTRTEAITTDSGTLLIPKDLPIRLTCFCAIAVPPYAPCFRSSSLCHIIRDRIR